MKQFFLFAGREYYPTGGWRDYAGSFDTVEEAVTEAANIANVDWWHVVDGNIGQIVRHGKRRD